MFCEGVCNRSGRGSVATSVVCYDVLSQSELWEIQVTHTVLLQFGLLESLFGLYNTFSGLLDMILGTWNVVIRHTRSTRYGERKVYHKLTWCGLYVSILVGLNLDCLEHALGLALRG